MKAIEDLINDYKGHVFIGGGKSGADYKDFEKRYEDVLKKIASNINAKIIKFTSNHYCFSVFFERDKKLAYLFVSGMKHSSGEWYNNLLVRTVEHEKDYKGNFTQYTTLENLEYKLNQILI